MRRLLIRPGAIGDGLCWFPALHALRSAETEVWLRDELRPLLPPGMASRPLSSTGFSLLGLPGVQLPEGLIETLRGFDEILSWTGAAQPELKAACASLRLPVHFFPALPDGRGAISDLFLQQTKRWHGLDAEPEAWTAPGGRRFLLPFLGERRGSVPAGAAAGGRPLVVLQPFSGSAAKNWPLAAYRELAASIGCRARVAWCAGPEDGLPADLAPGAWRVENLRELAIALNDATLFVGNDSGITHLAAMAGVPCMIFFGPTDPERWAPRGAEVAIVRPAQAGEAARSIPVPCGVDAVHRSLTQQLSGEEFKG